MGAVTDVADLVAYLAKPETAYITGAAIPVDGGAMTQQLRFGPRSRMSR
jgi:NAD(P)-dependent dehydrogenase (short-subunit alcohol dehydrogenase family)